MPWLGVFARTLDPFLFFDGAATLATCEFACEKKKSSRGPDCADMRFVSADVIGAGASLPLIHQLVVTNE